MSLQGNDATSFSKMAAMKQRVNILKGSEYFPYPLVYIFINTTSQKFVKNPFVLTYKWDSMCGNFCNSVGKNFLNNI